jgi:DNA topoisomerase IB
MVVFADALPGLRRRTERHLAGEGLGRDRVLACAVRLLDTGFFRIGSEGYAEENDTYGLATMRKAHVSVSGREVLFDYQAKGGKRRVQAVVDATVADVVRALKERGGTSRQLLAYQEPDGRWRPTRSEEINEFLRSLAGVDCTAKDFRTWNATVLAAAALAARPAPSPAACRRSVRAAMQEVATYLGNTPAVVRASYVDPRIVDQYLHGETIASVVERLPAANMLERPLVRRRVERAVLDLLRAAGESTQAA